MRPTLSANSTRRAMERGGFTLIETIAVISIVAILAMVAVPSLSTLSNTRAAVAARQVLHDLTFARQRAIATGTRSWVVFDVAGNSWSVLAENPASPGRAGALDITDMATGRPYVQQLGAAQYVGVGLNSAVFGSGAEVGFDWRGKPLNSTETPLAANGTVAINGNHIITVQVGTGLASYTGP